MTAKEAMAHPWLASMRELSLKRHAEEDAERLAFASGSSGASSSSSS